MTVLRAVRYLVLVGLLLNPRAVDAQSSGTSEAHAKWLYDVFGVQAGSAVDPTQFFVGAHALTIELPFLGTVLRPEFEVALTGDPTRIATDFHVARAWHPVIGRPLFTYVGGGPAWNVEYSDQTVHRGGLSLLYGIGLLEWPCALEAKVGFFGSPTLKVGFVLRFATL